MNKQNNQKKQEVQEDINPVNENALQSQDNEVITEEQDNKPIRHAGKHLSYILDAEKEINKKGRVEQGTAQDASTDKILRAPDNKTKTPIDTAQNNQAANLTDNEDKPLQAPSVLGAPPVRLAPKNWTNEDKELFSKLPKDGQDVMLKLNQNLVSGFNKKMQQSSGYKQGLEEMTQALTPIVKGRYDNFEAFISDVQDMHNFADQLKKNPYRTLAILANSNGVDLTKLAGYQPNPTEEALLPIAAQIEQINKKIAVQHTGQIKHSETQQEQGHEDMAQIIQTFTTAIDESGNPKYPHFSKLAQVMGTLIETSTDYDGLDDLSKLDKAYNEAVHILPQFRAESQKAAQAQLASTQQKSAQLAKAKAAASLRTISTGGNAIPKTAKGKNPLDYILAAEQQLANK